MEDFGNINKKLNELGIEPEDAGLKRIPNDTKKLDLESAKKILRFVDILEDDDDIQNVYHNLEMTDEIADCTRIEVRYNSLIMNRSFVAADFGLNSFVRL